jgi:hypothetical protein
MLYSPVSRIVHLFFFPFACPGARGSFVHTSSLRYGQVDWSAISLARCYVYLCVPPFLVLLPASLPRYQTDTTIVHLHSRRLIAHVPPKPSLLSHRCLSDKCQGHSFCRISFGFVIVVKRSHTW